jgi:hypothetical protein
VTSRVRPAFVGAAAAAVALRLAFVLAFPGNYDTESYKEVLGILDRGGEVYLETARYNYSPLWWNGLRAARGIGGALGLPLQAGVGLLLTAVDLATALVLYRLAGRQGGRLRGEAAALLFLWNPVSVFATGWHGQFDNIGILCLLLAVAAARQGRDGLSAGALGASLVAKHVAWFHPLLFALRQGNRQRLWTAVLPYLLFAATFLPYVGAWDGIRRNVLGYRGLGGLYGTDALLLVPGVPFWAPKVLFVAVSLTAVWWLRKVEIGKASLLLFLVTLLALPGIGQQYFVWPIALGALFPGPGYLVYTVVSALFFIGSSRGFAAASPLLPGWYGPWWAALLWLGLEARALSGQRPRP